MVAVFIGPATAVAHSSPTHRGIRLRVAPRSQARHSPGLTTCRPAPCAAVQVDLCYGLVASVTVASDL